MERCSFTDPRLYTLMLIIEYSLGWFIPIHRDFYITFPFTFRKKCSIFEKRFSIKISKNFYLFSNLLFPTTISVNCIFCKIGWQMYNVTNYLTFYRNILYKTSVLLAVICIHGPFGFSLSTSIYTYG